MLSAGTSECGATSCAITTGSFHKKLQFLVFEKSKIYYQLNDTKKPYWTPKIVCNANFGKITHFIRVSIFSIDHILLYTQS